MATSSKIEKKLLHYTGKAIGDYNMIQAGDKIMACLSGGKDSFTMLCMLELLRKRFNNKIEIVAFTLDQRNQVGMIVVYVLGSRNAKISFEIVSKDTYSIVKEKIPEGKTYCSLCSRLRRGNIYRYASDHGFTKIALGHHRDDLITTLLMSILYNGDIRSMPPKLLTDNKQIS